MKKGGRSKEYARLVYELDFKKKKFFWDSRRHTKVENMAENVSWESIKRKEMTR